MASHKAAKWDSRRLAIEGLGESGFHFVKSLQPLEVFVISGVDCVHLVDAKDGTVLQMLRTGRMLPRSLKCAFSCHQQSRPTTIGFSWFTLSYLDAGTRDCIVQTFYPCQDCVAVYLRAPPGAYNSDWCTWDSAKQTTRRIGNPGVWDMVADGGVVGVRRKGARCNSGTEGEGIMTRGLRNRQAKRHCEADPFERWEVWTVSPGGRLGMDECQRLVKEGEQGEHLLVTELGPKTRAGLNAVAFAFGDMIKLVVVGGAARLEESGEEQARDSGVNGAGRRRRPGTGSRGRHGT